MLEKAEEIPCNKPAEPQLLFPEKLPSALLYHPPPFRV